MRGTVSERHAARGRRGAGNVESSGGEAATDLIVRCAWCERTREGETWTTLRGDVHPADATHTICPTCFADLRARGLSA